MRNDKIKQLKRKILYEKKKMECCAYSKNDLRHLWQLESELKELEMNTK